MAKAKNELTLKHFVEKQFKTKEKLSFETKVMNFLKNENTIKPGMVEQYIYFVRSGIVQAHINDKNGEEKIFGFFFPGQLFCSASSYITQNPTPFTFTCLSDSILEAIPREKFHITLEHSLLSNKLWIYILEFSYLLRLNKEKDILTNTKVNYILVQK